MKRLLLKILYICLLVISVIGGLLFLFLGTTQGLNTAIKLGQNYLPGTIHITQAKGNLFKQFSMDELSYRQNNIEIKLQHIELQWQLDSLLKPTFLKYRLHAEKIIIINPVLETTLKNVESVGQLKQQILHIQSLKFNYLEQIILGSSQISIQKPYAFNSTIQLNPHIKSTNLLKGSFNIAGNEQNMDWNGEFFGPAEISIQGSLDPLSKLQQTIKWRGFHLILPANEALNSPEGRIQLSGILPKLKMELSTKISKSDSYQWQIQALLEGSMPWNWNLHAQLALNKGTHFLPKLGLDINPIDLNITTKDKHWKLLGSLFSSANKLIIKGEGPISSEPKATLFVEGENVTIADTQAYQIKISPKLQLQIDPKQIHISGTILVPYAKINPATLTDSVVLSEDVVVVTTSPVIPSDPMNTSMDIQVQMGEEVHLNFKGLKAQLGGMVNIKQNPQQPMLANGELIVKKGEFKAYAQDLKIDQGQLLFNGGNLDNPEIHLRASKNINSNATISNKMKVGVEVSGKLTAPNIQLFSNPATLSQADMLSMLVLGRPANQANKAGAQLLMTALSSMNIGTDNKATQLIEQLKTSLGFDVNVETNSNYNQITNESKESTGVVVGKSLSKRIYLSYNVGVSQADPNVLTLKYLLTQFLSIQVSSTTAGNGVDLIYTSDKNRVKADK